MAASAFCSGDGSSDKAGTPTRRLNRQETIAHANMKTSLTDSMRPTRARGIASSFHLTIVVLASTIFCASSFAAPHHPRVVKKPVDRAPAGYGLIEKAAPIKALPSAAFGEVCAPLLRVTLVSPGNLKFGEMILRGQIEVEPPLPPLSFPDGKIDWDLKTAGAESTYNLYLHAFRPVSYLCNAYESSKNKKFLVCALKIIDQWIRYSGIPEHGPDLQIKGRNKFLWVDHPTAYRTQALMYFYWLATRDKVISDSVRRQLVSVLYVHAVYLADPTNYLQFNHGLMMDRALLVLSYFLKDTFPAQAVGWRKIALDRLKLGLERDFTSEMVHRENSAAYHEWALDFIQSLLPLINREDVKLGKQFEDRMAKGRLYTRAILKPNNNLPPVGDTAYGLKMDRIEPLLKSMVFPEAGTAILCNRTPRIKDSTWLLFKSGYSTNVHKHADELSLLLFACGKDIFDDCSFLNYETQKLPMALRKATAHNTIIVDDASYEIKKIELALTAKNSSTRHLMDTAGLSDFETTKTYDLVKGFNNAYPGVKIQRTVLFLKPDTIVLYDLMESQSGPHKYSQLFNLGPEMQIARLQKDRTVLNTTLTTSTAAVGMGTPIQIVQVLPVGDVESYRGDPESLRGFYAPKFDQLAPKTQLAFTTRATNNEFLTVIGINQPAAKTAQTVKNRITVEADRITVNLPNDKTLILPRHL